MWLSTSPELLDHSTVGIQLPSLYNLVQGVFVRKAAYTSLNASIKWYLLSSPGTAQVMNK